MEYISEKADNDFCVHGAYILFVLLAAKEHELTDFSEIIFFQKQKLIAKV